MSYAKWNGGVFGFWLVVAAVMPGVAPAQTAAAPTAQPVIAPAGPATVDRSATARAIVKKVFDEQKLVGLSVVVAQNGEPVFEQHLGFEDREKQIAAGPQTMYRWASISKPVTATAAVLLLQSGKFELDADVRGLVPEFPKQPSGWVVTPRQLLGHQGGIVHYTNGKVVALPVPKTPEHPYADVIRALDTFKESPLVCEPGTKYSYTTHGYILLSAAVERAAGVRFATLVKDWIANSADMKTFRPDYQWEKIDHRAVGYRKNEKGETVRSTDTDVSWKLGGGGFISTVGDLSKFSTTLMSGQLVNPEMFALMRTPQKLKDGTPTTYGMGLSIGTLRGKATASHSGSQEKTATMMLMVPDEKLSVAIMCNTEGASLGKLAERLAEEWMAQQPARIPASNP